jgi:uncharacterized protein YkwD
MRIPFALLLRPLLPLLLWGGPCLGLGGQVPAEKASAFERAVVQEMSDARVQPKAYAKHLRALRDDFEGTLWKRPGRVPLRTEEGVAALDEAIAFLESARPLGPLRFNEGLARAARLHARDLGPRGALEHVGADGSRLSDRLNRLGTWHGLIAENISTGETEARQVVIQLLVDDGVANRGHRKNLFNPDLHQAGAGTAPHRDYRTVTVIDYADGFVLN